MSTTPTTRDYLAELIELKDATDHLLIETRYVASIRHAQVCAANARAQLMPFISDSAAKATEQPTAGTKPCK
jgi:hypothetical protein